MVSTRVLRRTSTLAITLLTVLSCSGTSGPAPTRPVDPPAAAVATEPVVTPPRASKMGPLPTLLAAPPTVSATAIAEAIAKTIAAHGEANRAEIDRGVTQVASLWRPLADGDLAALCVAQFVPPGPGREALFTRLQEMLEQIKGHVLEVGRSARWGTEVEAGAMLPVDELLAGYDAGAHVTSDLFASKVAFAALLNFPMTTLADRIRDGAKLTRRQWAEARLTGWFDTRVPSALEQAATNAEVVADAYVARYNLWMHHVVGPGSTRRFPSGKRLISHWNLRDELKANYADPDGVEKQRAIVAVMERIVTQTIPRAVIDNPQLDWDPVANIVAVAPAGTVEANAPAGRTKTASPAREPDLRFENMIAHFRAARAIDAVSPVAPTYMARAFDAAELPEARVRAMLVEILRSPLAEAAAAEIATRLGRKLEKQDLWYEFGGGAKPESELDAVTRKRYPTAAAFAKDLPRLLTALGFSAARAKYLAEKIAVDPSRGAGHAMGAERRGDKAHLRTRVEAGGMDYKGYNIAVHELGHNVEQTFSLYDVDHTLLAGVPNTAFTEALAFLFQARDLELLGRVDAKQGADERLRVLDTYWNTREIAGSALVELDVWQWLYEHPKATAADLRAATVEIAGTTWSQYYAPYLGGKDTALLGIYSHTIASPLYLFNYVVGHLIAFQVEEFLAGKPKAVWAKEFERVSRIGNVLPDLWMTQATGSPVSTKSLLAATAKALGK